MNQSPPLPHQPDWLGRNWRWFVPALVVALAGFFYGFFSLIIGVTKSSDAYQLAVVRAKASPTVIAALGTPITEGFFVSGNIHVTPTAGQAQLEIPLSGPKDTATLYVTAQMTAGVWHFDYLVVRTNRAKIRIDLK
jgi:hypothetical protein